MGLFKRFTEDVLRIKFVKNDKAYAGIPITSDKDDLAQKQIADAENGSLIDTEAIGKFRTLSDDRQERYKAYEEMLADATTAAAIEMYADDATQYDPKSGKVIWVESEEPEIAKAANRLLDVLQINEKAWRHIYSLCTYGDLYLRIYREGDNADYQDLLNAPSNSIRTKVQDEQRPMEEYVEYVEDPSTIYDLQLKDKTSGFVRLKTSASSSEGNGIAVYNGININKVDVQNIDLYDRRSFVHISLAESINRNPELLAIDDPTSGKTTVYKIKTGKSILADAYDSSQTVKLLEDSLLLSRLTKSALIRLLQIEVGDMPKPEVESLLRRVKNMIEQKIALNKNTGETRSYNSPSPMENIIYIPTKNGKGAITLNNLGGDVNIKDIADIEYFNNKKLSSLKIPKQYLNYDAPEGLGNGTSLSKLSSRYAHTIMRIQKAYSYGITTLLNLFFLDKDLDYINKFTVKMVAPATIEDMERDEQISNRVGQVSDIMGLLDAAVTDEGKVEILVNLLTTYLNLPDIASIVEEFSMASDDMGDDEDMDDMDFGGSSHSSSGGFGGIDSGGDFGGDDFDDMGGDDFGGDVGGSDDMASPPEPSMTPEA